MAELKTKQNTASVLNFFNSLDNEKRKSDSLELLKIFEDLTNLKPKMWGTSIIGYGMYHYKSERSSQEGDWPLTAFSPRKANISLYIMPGLSNYENLLKKLGKYKTGVSCLYINKLEDVDLEILKKLIKSGFEDMKKIHHTPS